MGFLRRLLSDLRGNVTIIFAISITALIGAAGIAIDYVNTTANKMTVQTALDAATLAGLSSSGNDAVKIKAAAAFFASSSAQFGFAVGSPKFTISDTGKRLKGETSFKSSNAFMSILAVKAQDIPISSTAINKVETQMLMACLHALNPTDSKALTFNNKRGPLVYSGPGMNAPKCSVQVNSRSSSATLVKETTGYNFEKFCIVGGVSGAVSALVPAPDATCKTAVPDPLSSMALPAKSASCASTSFPSGTTVTISPGTYCSGLSLSRANIVLQPGIYHIAAGALTLTASADITGNGVTFVMHPGAGAITIQTGGVMNLKAPTSGSTSGFLIMDKAGSASNHLFKGTVRDTSIMTLDGVIYAPQDHVEVFFQRAGVGVAEKPLNWTNFSLIADTIDLHGYNKLNIEPAKVESLAPGLVASGGGTGTQKNAVRLVN